MENVRGTDTVYISDAMWFSLFFRPIKDDVKKTETAPKKKGK